MASSYPISVSLCSICPDYPSFPCILDLLTHISWYHIGIEIKFVCKTCVRYSWELSHLNRYLTHIAGWNHHCPIAALLQQRFLLAYNEHGDAQITYSLGTL